MINIAQYDLDKAKTKEHVLEGLIITLKDINHAIELIRNSADKTEARQKLIQHFDLTETQANAVLDMKLSRLTRLDQDELVKELEELRQDIVRYLQTINDIDYRTAVLKEKIVKLKNTYGDARKTVITQIEDTSKEVDVLANVEPEKCVVVLTESGYIKRIAANNFKNQKRNGKGVKTQDDITTMILRTNTIDSLMIFSNLGKMYRLLVNDIPVGTNVSKGSLVKSLISMEANEKPVIIYSIYHDTQAKYVLFVTKNGIVKKTALSEYTATNKKSGIISINLKDGDSLAAVCLVQEEDIILLSKQGMGIRFNSLNIGATSRATVGLKGINLKEGDEVIAALPVRHTEDQLAIFTSLGMGKKISLNELPPQNRGGKGLICHKSSATTGYLAAAALVSNEDSVLLCGDKSSICISATEIPLMGRAAIGNIMLKGNTLLSASKV